MPMGLGFADALTGKMDQQGQGGNQTPIQDAIKVLSLRIPSFVGAQGIAPGQLLQGGGAGNFPFGGQTPGGLDEFLRRLFMGGMLPQGGGMPPSGMPAPNIVPGGEQRGPQVPAPQTPMPGGIVNPGSFAPNGSQTGAPQKPPMMGGGRPPFQQMR